MLFLIILLAGCGRQYSHDEIPNGSMADAGDVLLMLTEKAVEYDDNAAVQFRLALELEKADGMNEALLYINKAIQLDRENAQYYFTKARVQSALEMHEQLLPTIAIAIKLGYPTREANLLRGVTLCKLGKFSDAKTCFDSVMTKSLNGYNYYQWKGVANLHLLDTALAVKDFNRSIELNEKANESILRLANVYIAKGQASTAQYYLTRVGEEAKNLQVYRDSQIEYQGLTGNTDSSLFYLKESIRNDSSNYQYYHKAANLFLKTKKYDSVEHYTLFIPTDNKHYAASQLTKARGYDRSRKFSEAIATYKQLVSLDSTNNLAVQELENVKRKVAYLWRLSNQQQETSSEEPASVDE